MKEFFTFWKGIVLKLITNKDASYNRDGAVYQDTDRKVKIVLDGAEREVITNDQTQTLENKSIDAASNPITNIRHGVESDDPITAVHGVGAGDIVGTDKVQTITNKVLDIDNNTLSNVETDNLKAGVLNTDLSLAATDAEIPSALASKTAIESVAGDLGTHEADTSTHGVTEIVGASEAQTLTTKVISADDNTISELEVDNLKAGVLDTDLTAVSATDDTIPSAKATKDYIDTNDTAANTSYDNGASGLSATNVKDAIDEVDSNLEAHEAATTVHGIIGDVVGDQDVQQLTNKDFDGLSASDTSRITLPKNTTAGLDLLTDKEGTIAFDTDKESIVVNDGVNWNEVKGSGGGINYCSNPGAELDLSDWNTYNDGAVERPIDGTGGTSAFTFVRNTSNPLRGDADFLISSNNANRQGQGISTDFVIDAADQASMIDVTFDYNTNGYAYASGDLVCYLYDITNGRLISTGDGSISATELNSTYRASFQTSPDSVNYRFIIHFATTPLSIKVMYFDNVVISPAAPAVIGAPVTAWEAYTPTFAGFSTSVTAIDTEWRRVGDSLEIRGNFTTGTTAAVVFSMSLPPGLSGDISSNTMVGRGARDSSGFGNDIGFSMATATPTVINCNYLDNATISPLTPIAAVSVFASAEIVSIANIKVKIAGWSSGVTMSETESNRHIYCSGYLPTTVGVVYGGGYKKIPMVKDNDPLNSFDDSTNKYTIPEDGYYECKCMIGWNNESWNNGTRSIMSLLKGNDDLVKVISYSPITNTNNLYQQNSGSAKVFFNKGEEVYFGMYHNTGTTGTVRNMSNGAFGSYFSIEKTSTGTQTIAASEKVLVKATDTSATNITAGAYIPWNNIVTDSHNCMSGGVFTAPRDDTYFYQCSIYCGGQASANQTWYGEGLSSNLETDQRCQKYIGGGDYASNLSWSGSFTLKKGETFLIYARTYVGGATTTAPDARYNWLTITNL